MKIIKNLPFLFILPVLISTAGFAEESRESSVLSAVRKIIPVTEAAVGTVQSQSRVVVASQVPGQVLSLGCEVGQRVHRDEVLLSLDDREIKARFEEASSQYERIKNLLAKGAATAQQLDTAASAWEQARATLSYTRIKSPIDGIVAERSVETGDMAFPGKPLLILYDPSLVRLEARVRESLVRYLKPGHSYEVLLPGADRKVQAILSEVVPSADPLSRVFEVRFNFEPVEGVYPGMFGRVQFATGEREAVLVPKATLMDVGQLRMVKIQTPEGVLRRVITTGEELEPGSLEALSGLKGGEMLINLH